MPCDSERRAHIMSFDGDGVGAWPTGSHNEGTPLDVDALDEATRSQFEFLVSFLCHGNACACTAACAQRLQHSRALLLAEATSGADSIIAGRRCIVAAPTAQERTGTGIHAATPCTCASP